ncbi:UNVERIFIED_CONTAM: hypothetical protein Sangu_2072100 [Sesamum angustifolium]|uniref:Uncharacterized protein n=1 Tax=Sesamum angustifolium TaxID=2727405 RepID=A0AAW2LJ25_9LAMI
MSNSSIKPPSFLHPKFVEKVEENGRLEPRKGGGAPPEGAKKVVAPPRNSKLERKPTEDINESAEAFIKKFKQQLVLQRLESIENYQQMLKRGT